MSGCRDESWIRPVESLEVVEEKENYRKSKHEVPNIDIGWGVLAACNW